MSISKDKLSSIVDAIESKIISDVDRRIANLNNHDMQRYIRWREQRKHWAKRQENAYGAYLDGNEGPKLPQYLERKLFQLKTITKDMLLEDIRDAYDKIAGRNL